MKVHLYRWDGKALAESGVLDGNKGVVCAIAFSPDGAMLAAGDVRKLPSILEEGSPIDGLE
jgi:WD repeat-containing protein 1 (actin-interacting protein 1)